MNTEKTVSDQRKNGFGGEIPSMMINYIAARSK